MKNKIEKSSENMIDAISITKDSTLKKILDSLPINTKEYLSKNKDTTGVFINAFIKGFAGSIRICDPDKCEHRLTCPLAKANVAPRGYFCPNEIMFTDTRVQDYMNIYGKDKENEIETIIKVIELVSTQLMIERIEAVLAKDGMTVNDPKLTIRKTGEVVYGLREHPLLKSLVELRKTESDILTQLSKKTEDKDGIKDAIWAAIEEVEDNK